AALRGESGKMMAFRRISDVPYVVDIVSVPAGDVANKEKMFPAEWINADGTDVNENAYKYFLPLIQGEMNIEKRNGLPAHFKIREEILRG
ncbi:MAG: 6-phosphofructokinase, partial [Ruminiclostridium sp.]|nr:6-phosphofructokinase [Ruminiclostridium sp.]